MTRRSGPGPRPRTGRPVGTTPDQRRLDQHTGLIDVETLVIYVERSFDGFTRGCNRQPLQPQRVAEQIGNHLTQAGGIPLAGEVAGVVAHGGGPRIFRAGGIGEGGAAGKGRAGGHGDGQRAGESGGDVVVADFFEKKNVTDGVMTAKRERLRDGEAGEVSAFYRPGTTPPDLTYPNGVKVDYLATGATTARSAALNEASSGSWVSTTTVVHVAARMGRTTSLAPRASPTRVGTGSEPTLDLERAPGSWLEP